MFFLLSVILTLKEVNQMPEELYKKIFSKNLNHYMEINGKNQSDIVNDLGFNKSAVSTWCNGCLLYTSSFIQFYSRHLLLLFSLLSSGHSIPALPGTCHASAVRHSGSPSGTSPAAHIRLPQTSPTAHPSAFHRCV